MSKQVNETKWSTSKSEKKKKKPNNDKSFSMYGPIGKSGVLCAC